MDVFSVCGLFSTLNCVLSYLGFSKPNLPEEEAEHVLVVR